MARCSYYRDEGCRDGHCQYFVMHLIYQFFTPDMTGAGMNGAGMRVLV